jgi:hypothetical protein
MGQLDAALRDIEIMPTEFNLSEDERKTLTKQAAKELAELLKTSYKSIPKNGKLTPEQTIELFKVAAPLWREIAAMNWEYVQARVESTRLGAFSAVAEIISEFRANLPADDQDIDASDRYLLMRLVPTLLDENGDNRFYWSAKLLKHDIPWYQGHNAILSILQDS